MRDTAKTPVSLIRRFLTIVVAIGAYSNGSSRFEARRIVSTAYLLHGALASILDHEPCFLRTT